MYFRDLAPCDYGGILSTAAWNVPVRAVGWLEHPHPFPTGAVDRAVRTKLRSLFTSMPTGFVLAGGFCGLHECSLCSAKGVEAGPLVRSALNLLVPGEDCLYAVPGAIDHYFRQHDYLPPPPFIDAVRRCPDTGSPGYRQALRALHGGPIPVRHHVKTGPRTYIVVPDEEYSEAADHGASLR